MWADALLIIAAYLVGSIPVVYLLGRVRGFDLSREEDMHISLWRKVGRREGFIGISWDVAKGGVAVVIVQRGLDHGWGTAVGVGLAMVVARLWPVFLKFRGEKANTTSLGVELALGYQAWAFVLVPIITGAVVRTAPRLLNSSQSASERLKFGGPPSLSLPLGMITGFALFPVGCWYYELDGLVVTAGAVIFGLLVFKRVATGLRADLRTASDRKRILLNRALFDRSRT